MLAHSTGANLAALYVARYPECVGRLALITPSTFAVGIAPSGESRREIALLRTDEPWFTPAFAALEAIVAGNATDDSRKAIDPFAFHAPVLLLAGQVDLNSIPSVVAEFAELFPNAELVVQPEAGHFPWLDDADRFVATTATFLR
jgi:proline iminopeptidase